MPLLANSQSANTHEKNLIHRVKSLFGEEEVKLQRKADIVVLPVCGTPLMIELKSKFESLSPEVQGLLSTYLSRPTFEDPFTFDTPSGFFRIHYTTSGQDSVFESHVDVNPADGIPDYVNRCAEILDFVMASETDDLGYDPPPSDGGFPDNGGDGRYDVYLMYIDPGYLGYLMPEYFSPYPKATSYLVLRNDYSIYTQPPYNLYDDQYDAMKVTGAHEFFHAIQSGYDATEYEHTDDPPEYKPYWMEMSAVWMEDVVYDEINNYLGYLYYFFRYPWLSLKTFSYDYADKPRYYHAYASCVWPIYLSEKFGINIVKDIWTKCGEVAGDNLLPATDEVIVSNGSSFDEAFKEFTVWNFFTGSRADTDNFYSEGDLFPTEIYHPPNQHHTSYPAVAPNPLPYPPENLSSNYVYFIPDGLEPNLKIDFYGDSTINWKVSIVGYKSGNPSLIHEFCLDSLQNGSKYVSSWDLYSDIVMIPAVAVKESGEFDYDYVAFSMSDLLPGDVNGDGETAISDVVYLINYLFKDACAPEPLLAGDANCDNEVNIVDVVYLTNYLFKDGPPPCS